MTTHRAASSRHVLHLVLARNELIAPPAAFRRYAASAAATVRANDYSSTNHRHVVPVSEGHIRGAPSPLGFLPSSKPPLPKLGADLGNSGPQTSSPAPYLSDVSSLPDFDNLSPDELAERLRTLSPSDQFAAALAMPPERTGSRVRHLLALPVGDTVAEKHVRLAELRELIDYLSTAVDRKAARPVAVAASVEKSRRSRRQALLLAWGAWFDLARHLHSLAALPRLGGQEGRELRPEWFDSLLNTIKQKQDSNAHVADAERAAATWEAKYGFSKPTIRSVLEFMVDIGCQPTYFQLQILLQSTPMSELIEAKSKQAAPRRTADGTIGALASLVAPLTPESFAGLAALSDAHRTPKYESEQLRYLYLEASNQSLKIIEDGERRGLAPLPQWYALIDERRPRWTAFISRYVQQAAAIANGTSAETLALPTKSESLVLWLLLRELLIRTNRDLNARKHEGAIPVAAPSGRLLQPGATDSDQSSLPFHPFDLSDPVDLIRLSCGIMSETMGQEAPRRQSLYKRTNSCIVRSLTVATRDNWEAIDRVTSFMLRSARQEDVLCPGHSTAVTVPIPPTPIRTISYMLGACKTPDQLQRMLPRVEALAVLPGGQVSPVVQQRTPDLAALADRLQWGRTSPPTKHDKHHLEGRVQALLKRLDKLGREEVPAPPPSQ